MRPVFALALVALAVHSGFSQTLDYAEAPQEALGFSMGTPEDAVVAGLTASGTGFRQDPARGPRGVSKVVVPQQSLGQLAPVTLELQFVQGVLFQVSATVPYAASTLKALLGVLGAKYGPRLSADGGYHYTWFYRLSGRPGSSPLPDFAIVLASDPVVRRTIVLTYADNARRQALDRAGPEDVAADPAEPSLDPSRF